jgi:hypothetical protein
MGKRGIKICLKCSKPNGARSLQCASCGCGFIIKGVKYPDLDLVGISAANVVTKKAGKKEEVSFSFDIYEPTRYLIECADAQETEARTKNYGPNSKTWNSICGHFRVRYTPEFLGTSIEDSQKYTLFVKIGDLWRFPKNRTKFSSLKQLIKYMLKLNTDGTEKHKYKV